MKVYTKNDERTISEMTEIWYWMIDHFGTPSYEEPLRRWTYGKDSRGYLGGTLCDGTWDIEWFDFRDEKDATLFRLRWG